MNPAVKNISQRDIMILPSYPPELFIDNLESNLSVMSIISMCNPNNAVCYELDDYNNIFQDVYGYLRGIVRQQ